MKMRKLMQIVESERRWVFFFGFGFDPAVKKLILKNRFPDESLACQDEAARWVRRLIQIGVPVDSVEIHNGFYYVRGDMDHAEGHSWMDAFLIRLPLSFRVGKTRASTTHTKP